MLTSGLPRQYLHTCTLRGCSVLSPDNLPLRTMFTIVSLYSRVLIPNGTWQMEVKPRALSTGVELKVTKKHASCLGIQRHLPF